MASLKNLDTTARLSLVALEEQVLEYWDAINAFTRSVEDRPSSNPYVFYDGPPFVTGSPHYGSLLGSIAKDVVPRYWTMKGYRVERQWGWDCHGLPIENMIEKDLGLKNGKRGIEAFGIANFNNACRRAIAEFDASWEVIIRRIGRWVDFTHSYKTMDRDFMESVWWAFAQLHKKGLLYEGKKVILYCPRCGTPLSNFEIAMDNSYVDVTEPSTTYKFRVADNVYLLAWSTTPWTKLTTMALAVHPDLTYVQVAQNGEHYILAEPRLEALLPDPYTIERRFSGTELAAAFPVYEFPFGEFPLTARERAGAYRVIPTDFVTADTGTGIVTLAVYGEDDYRVMQDEHVPLAESVDDAGRLTWAPEPEWLGKKITSPETNRMIDEWLSARGLIYRFAEHRHSVATCYRCNTRLYYAPLPAWFINVQKLKPALLAANEAINWYPSHLKYGRFGQGIETAPDWNISRSRYWGTPIPVWRSDDGRHTRIIDSLASLREWAVNPKKVDNLSDIHREFVDDIMVWVDEARTIVGKRIPEVFDCWVESGSMPFASRHYPFENKEAFEASYPAQFISEYINQTRAWFYTMHVLSVALFGQPSFENAHTTGVVLAADGSKMSKSKKNYSDPMELIGKYGADALRLYFLSSPVTKAENLAFTDADVDTLRKRVLNIWWNVFVFYKTYAPATVPAERPQPTHCMDRWIAARVTELTELVTERMDNYDITTATRELIAFVDDLSQWYVRLSRDRLRQNSDLSAWQTFRWVLEQFALLMAPFTPFLAEATYVNLDGTVSDSVHLAPWPQPHVAFLDTALTAEMRRARQIIELGHGQRKQAGIPLRQPLGSMRVTMGSAEPQPAVVGILLQELNVKKMDSWTMTADQGQTEVVLDTTLTDELKAEGTAREIVRTVQQRRKDLGIPIDASIDLTLPAWPAEWESFIAQRTKARTIKVGEILTLEVIH